MNAIVLAAGHGKDMRGYAGENHKVMLPLGDNRPIIAHVVDYLLGFGLEPVVAVSKPKGRQIMDYFAANYPGKVKFSESGEPRGTAFEVYHARAHLDGCTFLVYYGDVIANVDLAAMGRKHEAQGNIVTLCAFTEHELNKGVIYVKDDRVTGFVEKPKLTPENLGGGYINCPVFYAQPELLDFIDSMQKTEDVEFDFGNHVIPALIEDGKRVGVYMHHGYYHDIGSGKAYEKALREL